MKCYGIKLPDSDEIVYIGLHAGIDVQQRFRKHVYAAQRGSRLPIHCWMVKHPNAICIELANVLTKSRVDLDALEIVLIAQYRSFGEARFNVCDGGMGGTSDSHRAACAAAQQRAEVCEKIRKSKLGKKPTEDHKRRTAEGIARGKKPDLKSHWTPEFRARQSETQKIAQNKPGVNERRAAAISRAWQRRREANRS